MLSFTIIHYHPVVRKLEPVWLKQEFNLEQFTRYSVDVHKWFQSIRINTLKIYRMYPKSKNFYTILGLEFYKDKDFR